MRFSLKARDKNNYSKAKRMWLQSVAWEEDGRRQREGLGGGQGSSAAG